MTKLHFQYDKTQFTDEQNEVIARALEVARVAHDGQLRGSGEPYLIHPIAVAKIVAEWGLDFEAVAAALLHDVIEDTPTTVEQIKEQFGGSIAGLVDGVTKLDLSNWPKHPEADSNRREISNENLRKLLLATAKDYRVIMVKLADRLHNLRTLEFLPSDKQLRIGRESLEIFAPIADRLGMGSLKAEMEDLSFRYSQPEEYKKIVRLVKEATQKSAQYVTRLQQDIIRLLREGGVTPMSVEGRQKHYYSIYKKLIKLDGHMEKMYDLTAMRILVPEVADCYHVLGVLHQHYKPLIYRIKDYIAVPKPNGYQSLHTTVFALDGDITEIQIRTPEMHEEAERGLSAHFYYDQHKASAAYAKGHGAAKLPNKLSWVSDLANLQQLAHGQDFLEGARLELFTGRIFVFSPRGDIYELPEGSTPLDFAFAVHSDVGLRAMGARVNGRLENRDVVEILTRREASPSRDWLNFVKTQTAKNRIRSWFRAASREGNIVSGRATLEAELKVLTRGGLADLPVRQVNDALDHLHVRSSDDLLAAIGEGSLGVAQAIRRLVPGAAKPASVPVVKRAASTGRILIEGDQLPYTLAPCCNPVFPQPVVGYVTRGTGVTVHSLSCRNLPSDAERYVDCRWETTPEPMERLACHLEVKAMNRVGLLSDITGVIAKHQFNIGHLASDAGDHGEETLVTFVVEVPDLFVLADLIRQLGTVSGVLAVRRAD